MGSIERLAEDSNEFNNSETRVTMSSTMVRAAQQIASLRFDRGEACRTANPFAWPLLSERHHSACRVQDAAESGCAWLLGTETAAEYWSVPGPVRAGELGSVRFRADDRWLFGTARANELVGGEPLESATERLYGDIFAVLAEQGMPHLLRLWNYIADINGEYDGLERYRHFNVGRQRAFSRFGRHAPEAAPAACALGIEAGPLTVHFLAGRMAPIPIENPRQLSAYRYPAKYGPVSPSFSRAALVKLDEVNEMLFISGTASILGHESRHIGDVRRQTDESLNNIDAVIAAANARRPAGDARTYAIDHLDCTVYVRWPDDLTIVRDAIERRVGRGSATAQRAIYLRADICRAELLVEIEAQAALEGM